MLRVCLPAANLLIPCFAPSCICLHLQRFEKTVAQLEAEKHSLLQQLAAAGDGAPAAMQDSGNISAAAPLGPKQSAVAAAVGGAAPVDKENVPMRYSR